MGRAVAALVLAMCLACGRIGFDGRTTEDGVDACTTHDDCASGTCGVGGTCLTSCRTWSAFSSPALVSAVATAQNDVGPELSLDALTLYVCTGSSLFVSSRASVHDEFSGRVPLEGITGSACDPTITGDGLELLYDAGSPRTSLRATPTASWEPSIATPGLPSSSDGPWLSKDGLRVYTTVFTNNDDIVFSSRADRTASFGPAAVVIGGSASDSYPSLTEDELTIVFSSNRGGADNDIWMATRASADTAFDAPVPIPELQSPTSEWDPALSANGDTIVFASRRNGDFDVFISTRTCLEPDSSL